MRRPRRPWAGQGPDVDATGRCAWNGSYGCRPDRQPVNDVMMPAIVRVTCDRDSGRVAGDAIGRGRNVVGRDCPVLQDGVRLQTRDEPGHHQDQREHDRSDKTQVSNDLAHQARAIMQERRHVHAPAVLRVPILPLL